MGKNQGQILIDILRGKKKINLFKSSELPSPEEKAKIIKQYAKKYGCLNLVETGTFLGNTIEATKHTFKNLYTIELGQDLYEKACERFKNDTHIKLYQGDSTDVLPVVLKELSGKTLFWLDGHYSAGITAKGAKDTPIIEELEAIYNLSNEKHVILIDDARCFGVEPDYPSVEELKQFVLNKWENALFEVKRDIMRIIL